MTIQHYHSTLSEPEEDGSVRSETLQAWIHHHWG